MGIEIVFETSESSNNLSMNEKILRPILYKRPFILITGKNNIQKMKDVSIFTKRADDSVVGKELIDEWQLARSKLIRFFENVLDLQYDSLSGIDRVDQAFNLIQLLIETGKIDQIIENCQEDIEHNYNWLVNQLPILKKIAAKQQNSFEYNTWNRPTYK